MPKLNEILLGSKDKVKQLSTLDSGQQTLLKLITEGLANGTGGFGDLFGGFDQDAFNKGVKDPALKTYQDEILPGILEKFVGQSGGSAMRRGVLKSGTDLTSKLAGLQYDAQQKQQANRMAGLNTALGTRSVENIVQGGSEGLVQGAVKGLATGVGQSIGGGIPGLPNIAKSVTLG